MPHRSDSNPSLRPRVLHIIYSLGRGGAETQLSYLAAGLVQLGWDVHIALVGQFPGSEINEVRVQAAGVTIHRLSVASNHDPRAILRVKRLIDDIDPDLVQTWLTMMDVIGGIATLFARKPWVMSERNAEPSSSDTLKMKLRRRLASRARMIVANSRSGIELWTKLDREHVRHEVVRNGLPHDELRQVEDADLAAASLPLDTELIVYAGRFEAQKNIENLLEAFASVVESRNATALLFGRGPLEQEIENFIAQRGLEGRIVSMGFVTDLWRWIKVADVFVSVSHFEGMPNTVMEAMALGRPIVLSDTSPHREICNPSEAIFVDRLSPERIAKGISDCLDRPEEAKARAAKSLDRTRGWSVEAASQAYDELYRSLRSSFRED